MSQDDLAVKCDFEKADILKIESGQIYITMCMLVKISIALDIDILLLLKD